ncbi:tyrosine protein phosphatase [Bacillaceae bacterium]
MFDIHCHILPQADDGAMDMEQAIRMAEIAEKDGITAIIATPHHRNGIYWNEKESILRKVEELNAALAERGLSVRVLPGMEVHVHAGLVDELQAGRLLPLNGSKYLLLELPFQQVPPRLEELVYEIQLAGFVPVIAHPERTLSFRERPERLYALVQKGALTQITAGSILGFFGKKAQRFSRELLDCRLTHVVASDAHTDRRRVPKLSEAYAEIARYAGGDVAETLKRNAQAIAFGENIRAEEPAKPKRKFFRLFG